eukprot:CAMPEP_0197848336 /NCGR_PEP_ID=MMETSP1438-20131217/8349_1 /TAXON_ID=1461541 /ORGANISM="Pterosperma sp., Strain CCMP1384" /LENGTH=91 /DNA_ID=CAMNT_0043460519 /DNA_START=173 /DNA_END=445 /DNA_ORIENTATION=+
MVFVQEYVVQLGSFGSQIAVSVELLHRGCGGMEPNARDAGKKFAGLGLIAKGLGVNAARWKCKFKDTVTIAGCEGSAGAVLHAYRTPQEYL